MTSTLLPNSKTCVPSGSCLMSTSLIKDKGLYVCLEDVVQNSEVPLRSGQDSVGNKRLLFEDTGGGAVIF